MKKNIVIICLLLWGIFTHNLKAQEGCNAAITPGTMPLCIMSDYMEDGSGRVLPVETGLLPNCLRACKGSSVNYSAAVQAGDSCTWAVSGAVSFTVTNGGRTLRVQWGSGNDAMIWLTVLTASGHVCTAEQCVELIESPVAQSVSFPPYMPEGDMKVITVCRGQEVRLEDRSEAGSSAITGSMWVGEFGHAEGKVFTFIADHEGEIVHIVMNDCGCESKEAYRVVMREGRLPEITCYGTACEGSTAGYKLADPPSCHEYNWIVEGGDIVSGQGTQGIEVQWGSPADGYGTLTISGVGCEDMCGVVVTHRIPVITGGIPITGETSVCMGDQELYEVPLWGSTKYSWSVSPPNGFIVHNTGMNNQYWLEFTQPRTYTIRVNYSCDFLDCNDKVAEPLIVNVIPRLIITGDKENICEGDTASFWPVDAASGVINWKIYRQNQLIASQTGATLTYVFNSEGTYRIVASGDAYCGGASSGYYVNVRATPAPVASVAGPEIACANNGIMLRAFCPPGYLLEWESPYMVDSNFITRGEASIHFGDAVGDVSVYKIDALTGCRSSGYTHHVTQFVLAEADLPDTISVCEGEIYYFSVPNQSERVRYEWTLSNYNLATIAGSNRDSRIGLLIGSLEVPQGITIQQFKVGLTRKYCGLTDEHTVIIIDTAISKPAFGISRTSACPGDVITAHIVNPMPNVSYRWSVNGTPYTGNPITFTVNSPGNVQVSLSYRPLPACASRTRDTVVKVHPLPDLFITCNDDINPFHITADATQNLTFLWRRNGTLIPAAAGSGLWDSIPGNYCCTATTQYGCRNTFCKEIYPPSTPVAPLRSLNASAHNNAVTLDLSADISCATVTISNALHIPADSLNWSLDCPPNMVTSATNAGTERILEFAHTGYCKVLVSGSYNGIDYSGKLVVAVPVIAHADFWETCIVVVIEDNSTYMHEHIPQARLFKITGENGAVYQTSLTGTNTSDTLFVNFPQSSASVLYNYFFINEACTLQHAHTFYKSPVVELSHSRGSCMESEILLSSNVLSGAIREPVWRINSVYYGGNSIIMYSDVVYPNIVFTYKDNNGCYYKQSYSMELYPNRTKGEITGQDYAPCIGDMYEISYQFNEPYSEQVSYKWTPDTTITGNTYPTYETGDYSVKVSDIYNCSAIADANIIFKNKPVALITGKTNYCKYDTVTLEGFSGDLNEYTWRVFEPQDPYPVIYEGNSTLKFVAGQTGNYVVLLEVYRDGCFSSDIIQLTVRGAFAPNIGFGNNSCIHEPPVQIVSVSQLPLYWSNGAYGTSADFYSPGIVSAYYYDSETGCKSDNAYITVWPQPNYEALLTGCYTKCFEFFEYPLGIYALAPYSLNYWGWVYQDQQIANGSYSTPAELPLIGPGDYMFGTQYVSGCVTESPHLIIKEAYYCSCTDRMDLSYNIKNLTCRIKNCRFEYTVDMILYNSSDMPLYLQSLSLQYAQLISCNGSSSFIPSVVPAHGYATYTIVFTADNPDSENFVFRFFSSDMHCYYDVPVSLNAEYYSSPCKIETCKGYLKDYKYLDEFERELPFTYHRIILATEPGMQIAAIRSEQGEILDYSYNSYNGIIDLLYLYDYNHLLQMANNKEEICFYVLLCKSESMCEVKICIPAKYLLENIPYRPKSALMEQPVQEELPSDSQSALTLHIVPNPAETEFFVTGINPKNISELKLLSLTGSEIKTVKGSAGMNISDIAPAIYIVRVMDVSGKAYYLKLVKQ
jgi:hypothetical protein